MEHIWIIGAGYFGLHALGQLSEHGKQRHFLLADPLGENLEKGEGPNNTLVQTDGITFLNQHLHAGNEPDWIIPALPLHLAAEWCMARLGTGQGRRRHLPPETDLLLPHPIRGENGDIYVSHATFRCPEHCAEPEHVCTVTREPRKKNMSDILENIRLRGFQSLVIRSRQLGPGVGGYRPGQLFDMLNHVRQAKTDCLISTACRCHGVISGVSGGQVGKYYL